LQNKKKHIDRTVKRLQNKLEESEFIQEWKKLYKSKFNMNSGTQLGYMLYEVKKIKPPSLTKTGKGSTNENSLSKINFPELQNMLQIKKLQKIRDTYLDGFHREQVDGFLHPVFNLHTVRTFRSSSSNPNFQNIPKRDKEAMRMVRRCIYPRKGHQLLEMDFSKLEVSIAACYHKDKNMIKYLTSEHNDMHGDLAQQIYKIKDFDRHKKGHSILRSSAKNSFIFPQFYGDYYVNCAKNLCEWMQLPINRKWKEGQGIEIEEGLNISNHLINKGLGSYQKFENHIQDIETDFWQNRFPDYNRWKKVQIKNYKQNGFVDMHTGFKCRGVMKENAIINYPVQGSAFHCLLWTFDKINKISKKENWKSRLVGQIHDAIVVDVYPPEKEMVINRIKQVATKDLVQEWKWINVPLQIEGEICGIDESWAEKKDL